MMQLGMMARRQVACGLPLLRLLACALWLTLIADCAAEPDLAEAPGTCKIDCSGQRIGSTDMRIRILTPDILLTCAPEDDAYPNSVPVRFVVEKPRTILPGEEIYDKPEDGDEPTRWTPVSGVSFHPIVLSGEGAVPNEKAADRFEGIQTPPDNWCTDSCGVGALDVQPRCPGNGNQGEAFRIGLFSGSLSNELTINLEVTTPTEE